MREKIHNTKKNIFLPKTFLHLGISLGLTHIVSVTESKEHGNMCVGDLKSKSGTTKYKCKLKAGNKMPFINQKNINFYVSNVMVCHTCKWHVTLTLCHLWISVNGYRLAFFQVCLNSTSLLPGNASNPLLSAIQLPSSKAHTQTGYYSEATF